MPRKRKIKRSDLAIKVVAATLFVASVAVIGLTVNMYLKKDTALASGTETVTGESTVTTESMVQTATSSSDDKLYKQMMEAVDITTIYPNIFAEYGGTTYDLGGLTKDEAVALLNDELQNEIDNKSLKLSHEDEMWELPYPSLNARYQIQEVVDNAYSFARTGTLEDRYAQVLTLQSNAVKYEIQFNYSLDYAEQLLSEIASSVNTMPKEAGIVKNENGFSATEGRTGRVLNVDRAMDIIKGQVVSGGTDTIVLPIETVEPKFTKENMMLIKDVLGSYNTSFSANDGSRSENLRLATSKINEKVIYPGEVFSMNEALGQRTGANGYKEAGVIMDGKIIQDFGGGVCQVTSTLYNAVLRSELEIVNRQNHSVRIAYVPISADATIAGDYIDFKFKNNLEHPIYIDAYISGSKIQVNMYGVEYRPSNRKLEFESVQTGSTPPPADKLVDDPTLPLGTIVYSEKPKDGTTAELYKKVFVDGVLQESIKINSSKYKSVQGQGRIGTGPAETTVTDPLDATNTIPNVAPPDNYVIPQETVQHLTIPQHTVPETTQQTMQQTTQEVTQHTTQHTTQHITQAETTTQAVEVTPDETEATHTQPQEEDIIILN